MSFSPDSSSHLQKYRRISYVCSICHASRSVIVDESMHLNREELKKNGLASYIDIHHDFKKDEAEEHGVKLYVDFNFGVRSNDPINLRTPKPIKPSKVPVVGIPAPAINLHIEKLLEHSITWNSLELSSYSHNVGFFLVNVMPSTSNIDNLVVEIKSPLESVIANVTFQASILQDEQIAYSTKWMTILVKWIELTASLNIPLIPSILRYIDYNHIRMPTLTDELIISILMDNTAMISLKKSDMDLKAVFSGKYNISKNEEEGFFSLAGMNYRSLAIVATKLESELFIRIEDIVSELLKNGGELVQKYIDSFTFLFFDLFRDDALEYKVSYLL